MQNLHFKMIFGIVKIMKEEINKIINENNCYDWGSSEMDLIEEMMEQAYKAGQKSASDN